MSEDDEEPRRQVVKRERREAGDRSATLAHTLMKVPPSTIAKLELDEDLFAAVERARAVTSQIARRRAERTLAGELRSADIAVIATRLANVQETGSAEPRLFQLAEHWRTKLLEGGIAAAAEFPGGGAEPLPLLIQRAQSERATGKPPGAARALFRHVLATLKARPG
ncbi:MAG: ribosome biogenesis factor YjgA [Kofleriaceae bacterium]